MRVTNIQQLVFVLFLGVVIGYVLSNSMKSEGFQSAANAATTDHTCNNCGYTMPSCPPMPDMAKYVLKTSVPPCAQCPDMSSYMLKTECPSAPDLSQYVLKSSVPKPEPVIIDSSACKKDCGSCPPCPRPRCPEVKCPPPVSCPACPPCPRAKCPEKTIKCKAEDRDSNTVRPYLTPLSSMFGSS
jgi:hypothetical protein